MSKSIRQKRWRQPKETAPSDFVDNRPIMSLTAQMPFGRGRIGKTGSCLERCMTTGAAASPSAALTSEALSAVPRRPEISKAPGKNLAQAPARGDFHTWSVLLRRLWRSAAAFM